MRTSKFCLALAAAVILALTGNHACLADGGNYEPDLNALANAPVYPGSVPVSPEDTLNRLSNDGLAKIEAFYRKHAGPNELIEPLKGEEYQRGFTVTYRVKIEGVLTERARLTVSMPDSLAYKEMVKKYPTATVLPRALTSLQQLVGRFGHTRADYEPLERAYQWLRYVRYFMEPGQSTATEGSEIYQRHYETVYGAPPKAPPTDKAGDAAVRADLEKKQKELERLQAEGKTQEMMALAMEMQGAMSQTAVGEQAATMQEGVAEGIQKDSWDEWVACLKEMAAAAYWVRLEYSPSEAFWVMPK